MNRTRKQWRNLAAECKWTARRYRKEEKKKTAELGQFDWADFCIAQWYEGRASAYKEIAEEEPRVD